MQERNPRHPGGIAALGFAALGVVFGDIGTSPLYTLKTVLDLTGDGSPATVLGVAMLCAALVVGRGRASTGAA
jgi:KUP system potassium uptake protein